MSTDTDVTVEKCREKFELVTSLEREEEGHKDRAKSVRKQIDNLESEIRRLITDSSQTEMPLGKPDPPEEDGMLHPRPDCPDCDGTGTAKTEGGDPDVCHCVTEQIGAAPVEVTS